MFDVEFVRLLHGGMACVDTDVAAPWGKCCINLSSPKPVTSSY